MYYIQPIEISCRDFGTVLKEVEAAEGIGAKGVGKKAPSSQQHRLQLGKGTEETVDNKYKEISQVFQDQSKDL